MLKTKYKKKMEKLTIVALKSLCKERNIKGYSGKTKNIIIDMLNKKPGVLPTITSRLNQPKKVSVNKTVIDLFKELGKFNSVTNTTVFVESSQFVGNYSRLHLGNGGSWCRFDSVFGRMYKVCTVSYSGIFRYSWDVSYKEKEDLKLLELKLEKSKIKGPTLRLIKICGLLEKINPKRIRKDIRDLVIKNSCVSCGSNHNIEPDHKNGLYNNPRVSNLKTQTVDDFQALCKHCNCQKRYTYTWQTTNSKRYPARLIPAIGVFETDFVCGGEKFDPDSVDAMVGTYWYDPIQFMKEIRIKMSFGSEYKCSMVLDLEPTISLDLESEISLDLESEILSDTKLNIVKCSESIKPESMVTLNYIGSKHTLISRILSICINHISDLGQKSFLDMFAGTGTVSFNFESIVGECCSNDLEYYSYIINQALLTCNYSLKIQGILDRLNNIRGKNGLVSKTYSESGEDGRMFFTIQNAMKCDAIREEIESMKSEITQGEYLFLIASLVTSVDKVANTSCVYGAYLKKYKKSSEKPLFVKPIHTKTTLKTERNRVFNMKAEDITEHFDVVYMDPPYNQRQYASNYAPLNYIAQYDENIETFGKTGLIRDYNKSSFCSKSTATSSFRSLVENMRCKFIILSYNNEGIIPFESMKEIMTCRGSTTLYKIPYKKFKAQESVDISTVYEYLWIINTEQQSSFTEHNL
jgi:adenine-specific DNA-methyltransferase